MIHEESRQTFLMTDGTKLYVESSRHSKTDFFGPFEQSEADRKAQQFNEAWSWQAGRDPSDLVHAEVMPLSSRNDLQAWIENIETSQPSQLPSCGSGYSARSGATKKVEGGDSDER